MILHNIFIIVVVLIALKFLFLLVVFILKFKYSIYKEEKQMCLLRKSSYLEWGNEFNEWYILPSISINFSSGFTITFYWLKIQYCHTWKVVTYEEEDEWASVHYNITNKENESSSV